MVEVGKRVLLLVWLVLPGCRQSDDPLALLQALQQQPHKELRARLAERLALEPVVGKTELLGHRVVALGLTPDGWTVGRRTAAVVISNEEDAPLKPMLVLACRPDLDPVMSVTVEHGQGSTQHSFARRGQQLISLEPVPPYSRRLYRITASRAWKPGPHDQRPLGVRVGISLVELLEKLQRQVRARRSARILRLMAEQPFYGKGLLLGQRVVSAGLDQAADRWSDNGRVAGVVVHNRGSSPWSVELELACDAPAEHWPVTVTLVTAGANRRQYFFHRGHRARRRVALPPAAPGQRQLTTISADSTLVLGRTERRNGGVRVGLSPRGLLARLRDNPKDQLLRAALASLIWSRQLPGSRALPGLPAAVSGLSPDGWTLDGQPGAVVITNATTRPRSWELVVGCDASSRDLPLSAAVDDGQRTRKLSFTLSGQQPVALGAVEPFSRRLFLVSTDRWWSPGTAADSRKLGVRLKLRR